MIIFGKQPVFYVLDNFLDTVEEIILAKKLDKKQFNKINSYNKKIELFYARNVLASFLKGRTRVKDPKTNMMVANYFIRLP